ncbi:AraC-like DNA-binding protein [Kineothrix alysoides]|uniref:AraC-like DNA-binding protein n=1 Tax=Kineothrix alysoides TaxID=1469948 RepID=A0A4R1R1W7_9FIRM|nr:AraC family transcriptional regulator [Kineothrix alysoides]TCL59345.1 AraC-like DNA-binding protein [Kineothrix alysoides]
MDTNNTLFTTSGVTDSNRILHTPGVFAKKNLLYVQEVGKLKSLTPHKSQRENLDSYLFLSVLSGEGIVTINGNEYEVKKGDCAFINCKNIYSHESSENKPWELMWVHFNGNMADSYFELFHEHNQSHGIFRPASLREIRDIIDNLMNCQKEKDFKSELLTGEYLLRLVNFCLISVMHQEKEDHETYRTICKEIREYINEHYQEHEIIQELVKKYKMKEEELDSYFQKMYGIALRDYIINRRFTAAKELLRFTIKPIEKVVEESGIRSEDLLYKLFQDSEGMTAEEYRMKWSQWVK